MHYGVRCRPGVVLGILSLIVTSLGLMLLAQGVPGGELTASMHSAPVTLDPHKQVGDAGYILSNLVYENLVKLDLDSELAPALAVSWESSEDLMTWTFNLREGVVFHDGSPLTAADVVFSIERILDPDTASPGEAEFSIVSSVEAVSSTTIEFTLNAPYADFPGVCTVRHGRIIPQHAVDEIATSPIGTGPFMLDTYVPSEQYSFTKNPNYWKTGLPYLDEVTIRVMPEISTNITALMTGEIDLLWRLPQDQFDIIGEEPGINISSIATPSYDVIIMNADKEPFSDPRVVNAVKYCIDQELLLEAGLLGYGTLTVSPIPPESPFFNPFAQSREQDYELAKALLAKAGYEDGLDITLYLGIGRASRERVGIALQQLLAPAGINVQIARVPLDKFFGEIEFNAEFYVTGFSARPTVDTMTYPMFHSTGSWNLAHWENAEVDALLEAARQTLDSEKQKYYYSRLQTLIAEDAPLSIPYLHLHFDAFGEYVKGYRSDPFTLIELEYVYLER